MLPLLTHEQSRVSDALFLVKSIRVMGPWTSWSNETVLRLIEVYQSHELLWDTANIDYRNKRKKIEAWEAIAKALGLQRNEAETKMHTLRSQFIREKKKLLALKAAGGGREDLKYSTWFAYDAMTFLLKGSSKSSNVDALDTPEQVLSSSEEENENETLSETPSTPPPRPKRPKPLPNETSKTESIQIPENTMDSVTHSVRMKDSDYETLGKSIGIQLRGLDRKQLTITQKLISDAIYYARMDMLTEKSHISLEREKNNSESPSDYTYQFTAISKTEQSP